MTKEQYDAFYEALISAKEAELHEFDKTSQKDLRVFEGCMPVEVMARRGYDTLRYGPMKPVGLVDARTGKESYAVVQLRRENAEGTMFNLVGFQTHLTFPEQKRVFSMIPGLENATFLRYGVMHRNTYLNFPGFLDHNYRVISRKNLFFAGQMTGGGVYRVGGLRACCRGRRRARRKRDGGVFVPPGHDARRNGKLRQPRRGGRVFAHERQFRHCAAACRAGAGRKVGAQRSDFGTRAGRAGGGIGRSKALKKSFAEL